MAFGVRMADLSDVEASLATCVLSLLYPQGLASACVLGSPVRVFRGWPSPTSLEADLSSGVMEVSIFPVPDATRNTTRWPAIKQVAPGTITLEVTVVGNAATISGQGGVGQVIGLLVDAIPFCYRCHGGETSSTLAATLAEMIRATRPCLLAGNTIEIPRVLRLVGRVAADGLELTEWSRQEQDFRITAWCPNPGARDLLCGLISSGLVAVPFLPLEDGTCGRLRYHSSSSVDDNQDAHQYRRDLIYCVEYGTSTLSTIPAMLFGQLGWADATLFG